MVSINTPNKARFTGAINLYELLTTRSFAERLNAEFDENSPFECNQIVKIIQVQGEVLFPDDSERTRNFYRSSAFMVRDLRNHITHNRRGPDDISNQERDVILGQIKAALYWLRVEGGPEAIESNTATPILPRKPNIYDLLNAPLEEETE